MKDSYIAIMIAGLGAYFIHPLAGPVAGGAYWLASRPSSEAGPHSAGPTEPPVTVVSQQHRRKPSDFMRVTVTDE